MNNIIQELKDVYSLLETIPVCGVHVEAMAAVRLHLRSVLGQLKEEGTSSG